MPERTTPRPLPEIRLPSPADAPPTVLPGALSMVIPCRLRTPSSSGQVGADAVADDQVARGPRAEEMDAGGGPAGDEVGSLGGPAADGVPRGVLPGRYPSRRRRAGPCRRRSGPIRLPAIRLPIEAGPVSWTSTTPLPEIDVAGAGGRAADHVAGGVVDVDAVQAVGDRGRAVGAGADPVARAGRCPRSPARRRRTPDRSPLPEIRLPSPGAGPPMVLSLALETRMPFRVFPRRSFPSAEVPIRADDPVADLPGSSTQAVPPSIVCADAVAGDQVGQVGSSRRPYCPRRRGGSGRRRCCQAVTSTDRRR